MTKVLLSRLWPVILLLQQGFGSQEGLAQGKAEVPPSWQGPSDGHTSDKGDPFNTSRPRRGDAAAATVAEASSRLNKRPWYLPRASLGLSVNVPEIFAVESYLTFGRYFGIRLFYAPPIPITVRVEMPSDLIAVKSNVGIANPAFTIHGQLTYGEHYGAEAMVFPFAGSFFLMGGASHRRIRLVADAQSPILICSGDAILAADPCSDPKATIQTQIQLKAHADVMTEATLLRAGLGWFWHIGSFGYFTFDLGAAKPMNVKHNASLSADIVTPAGADAELNSALEQMRAKKLADLRTQTLNATQPVDRQVLPILGVGAGIRF